MFREELEYREKADAEEVQQARESAARILGQLCDEGEIEFVSGAAPFAALGWQKKDRTAMMRVGTKGPICPTSMSTS